MVLLDISALRKDYVKPRSYPWSPAGLSRLPIWPDPEVSPRWSFKTTPDPSFELGDSSLPFSLADSCPLQYLNLIIERLRSQQARVVARTLWQSCYYGFFDYPWPGRWWWLSLAPWGGWHLLGSLYFHFPFSSLAFTWLRHYRLGWEGSAAGV